MICPRYFRPDTLAEALEMLAAYEDARPLAGGTDLVPAMRAGSLRPEALVDLGRLPLRGIVSTGREVAIGATVTHRLVADGAPELADYPALRHACASVGSPPIQNRGTLAGNLCHASPAADSAPALLVYDASVCLQSAGRGERGLPVAEFFCGPGRTALAAVELLTRITLPPTPSRTFATFFKMGRRQAMAIAVVNVAARLTLSCDGRVEEARVALGSVAPAPMRATAAEALLVGSVLDEPVIRAAAEAAARQCAPISDIRASASYRRRMVAVQVRRALENLWLQSQAEEGCCG